jgi:hypothetical protein
MSHRQGGKHPRTSLVESTEPRFLNPSSSERNWIGKIPDNYPDILRAPAVSYKSERDDSRISANKYVSFVRPYKGKQGLLLIGVEQRPVIIDESEPDKPHIMPMRLDRESISSNWIFSVSIYKAEGLIQLEDCIVADGKQIRSTMTYSDRFTKLQKFASSVWFEDKQFQLGWQIRIAQTLPLESIRLAIAGLNGGYICLMPDSPVYRLLKVVAVAVQAKPIQIEGGPREFICTAVEGKPDVYDLKGIDGSDAGRASIQTLTISQGLRQKSETGQQIRVLAEWNADFESYIVLSIL